MTRLRRTHLKRGGLTLACALAACAPIALPATAAASKTQESIFQSDGVLMGRGSGFQAQALTTLQGLGVDTVHVLVLWSQYAPKPTSRHKPSGFNGADPADYAPAAWDKLDDLVRGARQRGMDVLISPVAPVPLWASLCKSGGNSDNCEPKPAEWKAFITALARRYIGSYHDENDGGGVLPAIRRWTIWNEPNQHGWLIPQFKSIHGKKVPYTPIIFRRLINEQISALHSHGHARDQILMGDLAPIGSTTGTLTNQNMKPVLFLNELFCLDSAGHRYSGQAARDRQCTTAKRFDVQGISHHPYTRAAGRPPFSTPESGSITLNALGRLKLIMKRAARAHMLRSARLPIYLDEYGFQTDPPDHIINISLTQQAQYINESDWFTWKDPQIAGVGQFLLEDSDRLESFQTGLTFVNGDPKPSFAAYRTPIWATPKGNSTVIWGQLRPAPANSTVPVLIQRDGGSGWVTVKTTFASGKRNYFQTTVSQSGGRWRLAWTMGGQIYLSREAKATNKL